MSTILRRPRAQQPMTAVGINRDHPLAFKLEALYGAMPGMGEGMYDATGNYPITRAVRNSGGVVGGLWKSSPVGLGISHSAANNDITRASDRNYAATGSGTPITFAFVLTLPSTSTANLYGPINIGALFTPGGWIAVYINAAAAGQISIDTGIGGLTINGPTAGFQANVPFHLVVTYLGGTLGTSTALIYVDSVLQATSTVGSFSGPLSLGSTPVVFGSDTFGLAGGLNGASIVTTGIWSRGFTQQDVNLHRATYWDLFGKPTRRLLTPDLTNTISRPGSDVSVTGWTWTGASLAASINEPVFDDASYATSPALGSGSPAIETLDLPLAAGNWTVSLRGLYVGTSGQIRITLMDSSSTSVGVSAWQALTSSFGAYDLAITTTGTATRVQLEVQA